MRYLLLILLIVALVSCKAKKQEQQANNVYFEGIVEFNNSCTGRDEDIVDAVKSRFGVKTICYISNKGFVSREYIDLNDIIIARQIYRPDLLKYYNIKGKQDTIFSRDASKNNNCTYLGLTKDNSIKILGHNVEISKTITKISAGNPGKMYYVSETFFNDINYLLNPAAYKNEKYNCAEEVFSNSPYITTMYVHQHEDKATWSSTATRIIPSPVADWHFEIPKNKIIVEQRR